ncbi:MAG: ubiquinone biosynthesis regulatory protein kinase UbiB [Burkholderiales bacterium]|nr:ubiquinone biosynthesis regulatory protein kinase UbiB [Burkholderiales bacterium]
MRFLRLLKIILTLHRYGLYEILKRYHKISFFARCIELSLFFIPTKCSHESLPKRTRLAFEELGPVFIKFGQLLSTRQDLLSSEFIQELSKLQNQVQSFSGIIAKQVIERSLNTKLENIFSEFNPNAVASASIAQVHKAILKSPNPTQNNRVVAVKVLRPNIEYIIEQDILVLQLAAWFVKKAFRDGERLRPQDVIEEFKNTIHAELDFLQEAANATELYRLHKNDPKIIIPQIFYDYCSREVLVLEWMDGIPISDLDGLKSRGINLEKLSHNGVDIFYTQVFNYGFFHADMHPGNILCDNYGHYIALDFGIVGILSEEDKRYLAINILAFFNRDYKTVAKTHVESGWAPPNTPVEALENAIRAVCEPIFNKPLSQISFGQVLIKLFQVSRRFNIIVQPQLLLLQKTIVNVEGMGRMLNPNLDLWVSAKPILEKWMHQQMGWRGFLRNIKTQLPYWSYTLPLIPRQVTDYLVENKLMREQNLLLAKLLTKHKLQNFILSVTLLIFIMVIGIKIWNI